MTSQALIETDVETSRDMKDWLAPSYRWSSRIVVLAVLIGLAVGLLAFVFRTEIVPTDPWRYVQSARDFPDDSWVPLGYTRYGMILPLLPLTTLFGDAAVTYYFWPIVCSGLLASCLYLIGYRFWGHTFGLLAVVLAITSPITFINLSRGYPDVQSTGILTFAVVLALAARDNLRVQEQVAWWWWVSIGFLLGWAFEARETTILVWPIIALILWVRPVPVRGLLFLTAGTSSWAVADILIGGFGYADAFMRVHAFTRQDLATGTNPADQAAKAEYVGRARSHYLSVIPTILATKAEGGIWTLALGGLGIVGLAFRGGARFVSTLFLLSFLTFVGITGGFVPDHPSGRIDVQRYWIAFVPYAGLAAAGATAEIASRAGPLIQRWQSGSEVRITQRAVNLILAVIVALGPCISLAVYAARAPTLVINGADQLPQLRDYLASTGTRDARIYTDWPTARLLPTYQRGFFGGKQVWTGTAVSVYSKPGPKPGDLVVINALSDQSCPSCHKVISRWYKARGPIPENWTPIWTSDPDNLVLYRVT